MHNVWKKCRMSERNAECLKEMQNVWKKCRVSERNAECLKEMQKAKPFLSKPLRHIGGEEVQLHSFLTSALDRCKWTASRPGCFVPGTRVAGSHCMGEWEGTTVGLGIFQNRKNIYHFGQPNHASPDLHPSLYTDWTIVASNRIKRDSKHDVMLRIYFHKNTCTEDCSPHWPLLTISCVRQETQNKTIFTFIIFVSEGRAGETWKHSKKTMLTVPKQMPLTLPSLLFHLFVYYIYSLPVSRKGW